MEETGTGGRRRAVFPAGRTDDFDSMSAPVQVGNTLESAARQGARRAAGYLAATAGPRRPLVRGAHRRHHARIRLHPVSTLALSAGERAAGIRQSRPLIDKAVRSILDRQLPDGGFNIYVEGPSEVSASVKAYFALKLAGLEVDDPRMARLRRPHPGTGRHSGGQQLRQGQPEPVRPLSAAILPQHSARSGPAAVQFPLPDVVVDARHRGVAVHCACVQSAASGARRASRWTSSGCRA